MTSANGTTKSLAEALVAFQAEAPHIELDSQNPHFRSKFASLAGVMKAVRPVLSKHGLALIQPPTLLMDAEGQQIPAIRTILIHTSGERIEDTMPLAVEKPGPQAQGSAITYARRYSVLAFLGLVGDEDDDANSAEQPKDDAKPAAQPQAESQFRVPQGATSGLATDPQKKKIRALANKTGVTDEQLASVRSIEWTEGMDVLDGLTKSEASGLIDRLTTYETNLAEAAA